MTTTMRGHTITETTTLVTEACCECGVLFAITTAMRNRLVASHDWFYCPSGHKQHYTGPSDAEKAQQEAKRAGACAERLLQQLASREEDVRSLRVAHAATKGQLTKAKKRAAAGVCPCCSRSFQNVARHVAGQHPEHVAEVLG